MGLGGVGIVRLVLNFVWVYHEGTAGSNLRGLVQEGGWGCGRADLGDGLTVGDGVKWLFL